MGGHEAEVNARSHRPIRHVFIFHTHSLLSRQTLVGTQAMLAHMGHAQVGMSILADQYTCFRQATQGYTN